MVLPLIVAAGVGAGIRYLIQSAIIWGLASFFGRLVTGLGIGTVTFFGLKSLIQSVMADAVSYFDLPAQWMPFLGVAKIDVVITIWTSALLVKATMLVATKFVMRK